MSKRTGPRTVYLIRHGEKLGSASDEKDGGPDLSVSGSARAARLPTLFMPNSVYEGGRGGCCPKL